MADSPEVMSSSDDNSWLDFYANDSEIQRIAGFRLFDMAGLGSAEDLSAIAKRLSELGAIGLQPQIVGIQAIFFARKQYAEDRRKSAHD